MGSSMEVEEWLYKNWTLLYYMQLRARESVKDELPIRGYGNLCKKIPF